MVKRQGRVVRQAGTIIRDGGALVTTALLSSSLKEIGALASLWVSPMIAQSTNGKDFNRMFAILMLADTFMERMAGGKGVI